MAKDNRFRDYKNKILKFLSNEAQHILSEEIDKLDKMSLFTKSITETLESLYSEKFPKKCNTCGRMYNTREDFIAQTQDTIKHGVVFWEEFGKLQEYRNCVCGSTLLVATDDRRDNTEFGIARRELFLLCVQKVKEINKVSEDEAVDFVRELFRDTINRVQEQAS